ncbi:MAG: MFS transporter, partial [Gammaproteobacteria bacterium]|nr:MFS transporter [Gammaproteobacteria bacterium]
GATYSAFQLIGPPILGRWSDRYGRRKILLLSQLGTLLSWMIFLGAFLLPENALIEMDSQVLGQFTLTLPLIVLFIARAADGITGGNVSVANAYLADITDEDQRNQNFGKMAVSGNLGFVFGPALAGLLGATIWGEILPVVAALLISLVATFIIAVGLKESNRCTLYHDPEHTNVRKVFGQEHKECFRIEGTKETSLKEILSLECIPALLAIYFMVMLGFSFFYIAFPIYAVKGLAWSVSQAGVFFAILSLLMVVVQGPILARASKKWTDRTLVIWGSLVLSLGFALLMSSTQAVIYMAAALIALGNGLMWPSVMSTLSKRAGETYQGAVQGFASSVGAVASIVGLVTAGLLYNLLGARVFIASAIIIFIVFATASMLRTK